MDINDTLVTYTCITVKFLKILCGGSIFWEFYGYTPYPQTIASKMNYLFIIQQPNDPLI